MMNESGTVYNWQNKLLSGEAQDNILKSRIAGRLNSILPSLMEREGIDMWVVPAVECNNDPVWKALTGSSMARRVSILIFSLKGGKLWTGAISRYEIGVEGHYNMLWEPESGESQWECLGRVVAEMNPKAIGLNYSDTFAFGDGISHSLYMKTAAALKTELSRRIVSAAGLAVGFMETRTAEELAAYEGIVRMTKGVVAEIFSERIVHPGVTDNEYILGLFQNRITGFDNGYVKIQRRGYPAPATGSDQDHGALKRAVIMPGDLLRCDCGMPYMGLHSDIQQNAYVLRQGEDDAPQGLKDAMRAANRLQDIVCSMFAEGRTGNEILSLARKAAIDEGLNPCIYAHPIGMFDHGPGPTIGLWDCQGGVPGAGDYPVHDHTCYALELNNRYYLPEWEQEITLALEEEIAFVDGRVYFIGGRQTEFYLIR